MDKNAQTLIGALGGVVTVLLTKMLYNWFSTRGSLSDIKKLYGELKTIREEIEPIRQEVKKLTTNMEVLIKTSDLRTQLLQSQMAEKKDRSLS